MKGGGGRKNSGLGEVNRWRARGKRRFFAGSQKQSGQPCKKKRCEGGAEQCAKNWKNSTRLPGLEEKNLDKQHKNPRKGWERSHHQKKEEKEDRGVEQNGGGSNCPIKHRRGRESTGKSKS